MSNLFCRNPNASEFRGAAHDLIVSRIIFSNLPKLSKIVAGMPQVSTICANYTVPAETSQAIYFHELCKKYLTSSAYYCIIGAARLALLKTNAQLPQKVLDNPGPCAYTTRVGTGSSPAETTSFEKNFTQSCKKDLTNRTRTGKMARGTPKKVVVALLLARRRQKSWRIKCRAVCPGLFHVEHYARRSHRVASRFLMPRFLLEKSTVCQSESITRSFKMLMRS